eukprot:4113412-Alexandrium_andersonii.AAC.1
MRWARWCPPAHVRPSSNRISPTELIQRVDFRTGCLSQTASRAHCPYRHWCPTTAPTRASASKRVTG